MTTRWSGLTTLSFQNAEKLNNVMDAMKAYKAKPIISLLFIFVATLGILLISVTGKQLKLVLLIVFLFGDALRGNHAM